MKKKALIPIIIVSIVLIAIGIYYFAISPMLSQEIIQSFELKPAGILTGYGIVDWSFLDYKFHIDTHRDRDSGVCRTIIKVYKSEQEIFNSKKTCASGDYGKDLDCLTRIDNPDFKIEQTEIYSGCPQLCDKCGSRLLIYPKFIENKIQHEIIFDEFGYYQNIGTSNIIKVRITNDYDKDIDGIIWFKMQRLGQDFEGQNILDLDRSANVLIKQGTHDYNIIFPTNWIYGWYIVESYITPKEKIPLNIVNLLGSPTNEDYYRLTPTIKEMFENYPQPNTWEVYPGQDCPTGYIFENLSNTNCKRADLSSLPCQIIGCPINIHKTMKCTNAGGLCAEIVDCQSDLDCGLGLTCKSGTCYNKAIYDELFYCNVPSDCYTPCPEKNVPCENNECMYDKQTGECTTTPTQEEILKARLDALKDLENQLKNKNRNEYIYIGIISIISILLVIVLVLLFKKRR
jgi:hypothetical protein